MLRYGLGHRLRHGIEYEFRYIFYITLYTVTVSGQNATMSKTDKMPQCKWCNKGTVKVLQGCNKSVTRV